MSVANYPLAARNDVAMALDGRRHRNSGGIIMAVRTFEGDLAHTAEKKGVEGREKRKGDHTNNKKKESHLRKAPPSYTRTLSKSKRKKDPGK